MKDVRVTWTTIRQRSSNERQLDPGEPIPLDNHEGTVLQAIWCLEPLRSGVTITEVRLLIVNAIENRLEVIPLARVQLVKESHDASA